jgi:acetyl-CoA carboxylase, biotin carboxylase subunit
MFESVLIANRGEIAMRIARTCKEMGIRTVAAYSTADRDSAIVGYADQAVHIGPAAARRSYLSPAALLAAAERAGVDAVHPGYGFLSENADFAAACAAAGVTFIGPSPEVLATLGDKISARELMTAAGLPMLPGALSEVRDADQARRLAAEIGYPLIVKASAGGGGRAMRVVREPAALHREYDQVRATAQTLFGDGRVYLERYLPAGRHVEVQVLCDQHGHTLHLGTRDCSVQRRHQKLVEEAPAPRLAGGLAQRLGQLAVTGCRAAGYVGAGTFEFLVDGSECYFLETNCRLQVEHPVTEMVTGLDLVREQLQVAAGRPLSVRQEDVAIRGTAIECRINAEDPARDYVPAPGLVSEFVVPGGPFVRVDTHVAAGYRVPAEYDSLLAKLIVWAPDRPQAIERMRRALGELRVEGQGIATTAGLLARVLDHPLFRQAEHDTSLLSLVPAA